MTNFGFTWTTTWPGLPRMHRDYRALWQSWATSKYANSPYGIHPQYHLLWIQNTWCSQIQNKKILWSVVFCGFNMWLKIPLPITYLKGACLEQGLFHLHHLSLRVIYEQPRWDTAHMQQLVCHHDAGVLTLWRKLIAISVLWPPRAHTPLRDVVMRRVSPNPVREAAERRVWMDL